jgi:hypothetical protein
MQAVVDPAFVYPWCSATAPYDPVRFSIILDPHVMMTLTLGLVVAVLVFCGNEQPEPDAETHPEQTQVPAPPPFIQFLSASVNNELPIAFVAQLSAHL